MMLEASYFVVHMNIPFLRLMNSNFSATNVSKLILTDDRPASLRDCDFLARVSPLVVREIVCKLGRRESLAMSTRERKGRK